MQTNFRSLWEVSNYFSLLKEGLNSMIEIFSLMQSILKVLTCDECSVAVVKNKMFEVDVTNLWSDIKKKLGPTKQFIFFYLNTHYLLVEIFGNLVQSL